MGLRVNTFRLRIIHIAIVYSVLAILPFFLLAPLLKFYAFLATVAHNASSSQCKRPGRPLAPQSAPGAFAARALMPRTVSEAPRPHGEIVRA
jgi:hypothetical protein